MMEELLSYFEANHESKVSVMTWSHLFLRRWGCFHETCRREFWSWLEVHDEGGVIIITWIKCSESLRWRCCHVMSCHLKSIMKAELVSWLEIINSYEVGVVFMDLSFSQRWSGGHEYMMLYMMKLFSWFCLWNLILKVELLSKLEMNHEVGVLVMSNL